MAGPECTLNSVQVVGNSFGVRVLVGHAGSPKNDAEVTKSLGEISVEIPRRVDSPFLLPVLQSMRARLRESAAYHKVTKPR